MRFQLPFVFLFAYLLAGLMPSAAQETVSPEDLILPPAATDSNSGALTAQPGTSRFERIPTDPTAIAATVNGEPIYQVQAENAPIALEQLINTVLIRQTADDAVSVYDERFVEHYRAQLWKFASSLYLEDQREMLINKRGLNEQFDAWLEGHRDQLQAEFPVWLILRQSLAEARALQEWLARGYEFRETARLYSVLPNLIETSPIGDRIDGYFRKFKDTLQNRLKPGEMIAAPIQTPYGWVLAKKSPFESGYRIRVEAMRREFMGRWHDVLNEEILQRRLKETKAVYKPLPDLSSLRLPLAEDDRKQVLAHIPDQKEDFRVTLGDVVREYQLAVYGNPGVPAEVLMQKLYANLVRTMIFYEDARNRYNETHPEVRDYSDALIERLKQQFLFDQMLMDLEESETLIEQRYQEFVGLFSPLKAVQLEEVSAESVSQIMGVLNRWQAGESFDALKSKTFFAHDMRDFFHQDYVVLEKAEDGAFEYLDPADMNRFGAELLIMNEGDIVTNPIFHGSKWTAFHVAKVHEATAPPLTAIAPGIVRSLHLPARARLLEVLKQNATITITGEDAHNDRPEAQNE